MNNFNYFFTPVGPEYKKKFARNVGIAVLILFAFYGVMNLFLDTTVVESEPDVTDSLKIPNAERDAKLAIGCKLYPGGWVCPDVPETVNLDSITTMEPDSAKLFYYPHPEDTENRDPFQLFMIIRLPEWLGGGVNDVSAYRVYSTQSVDDPCMVKYWSGEDRQRIENPCKGGFYRVYDGIMILGFGSVPSTHPVALPHLDLLTDENGFLFIEPPLFSKTENGVIGYGREVSQIDIADGSQFYIDSFAKHFPTYPQIRKNFAGLMLADIVPLDRGVKILYSDFGPISNLVDVTIFACNCDNIRGHHSYETIESLNGVSVAIHDTKSQHPQVNESINTYYFRFVKDGHEYNVSGKDHDSLRKSIVSFLTNYDVPITPEIGKTGTYKFENDGMIYDIKYSISGASIEDIFINDIEQSLFVEINSIRQGSLEITIPRELHDSKSDYCPPKKENPPDGPFFVLLDGIEIAYDETQTTSELRTLMIQFDSDSSVIEVISTCLV